MAECHHQLVSTTIYVLLTVLHVSRYRTAQSARRENLGGISKKMILVVAGLLTIFVFIQFFKLATVGTLGSKISQIKQDQEMFELENEMLRAEISELKSPSNLEEILNKDKNLEQKQINIISSTDTVDEDILAQR